MTDLILDDIIAAGGPIEPHLAALASEVNLPDIAVAQCALRVGEVAPALRAIIAKAADGEPLSDGERRLLLRGIFILAGRRDTETFPVFLRLLRRPEAELVDLLDDVIETRLAPLLSGMFDGDAEALLGLAHDAGNAEDVRFSAIESAAFLTFDGRIPRERMRAFLADYVHEPHANDDVALFLWADAIAKLGLRDLAPLIHAAFAEGRIAEELLDEQEFDEDLAAAEAAPGDASRFEQSSYIRDILEALDWSRTGEAWDLDALSEVDPDAPIDVHLDLLGTEMHLPEVSLRACVARFDEAASRLHTLLDRAAAGRPLSDEESLRFFRGLFVLAAARDTDSCPSLLRLLRRPTEETEELLGDAITVSLPRLLISLFDGDAEALLAVVADRALDGFLRGSTLEAATYLAWEGRINRERLSRLLLDFYEKRLAEDEEFVWYAWMQAVAMLDLRDLVPKVEAAWKAGRIDRSIQEWSDFRNDLARARTEWDDVRRFDFAEVGYVDDVVAELGWTRDWGEEEYDGPMGTELQPPRDLFLQPVVNPLRDVGRNDPCPCGSGKKYKKCCLANG